MRGGKFSGYRTSDIDELFAVSKTPMAHRAHIRQHILNNQHLIIHQRNKYLKAKQALPEASKKRSTQSRKHSITTATSPTTKTKSKTKAQNSCDIDTTKPLSDPTWKIFREHLKNKVKDLHYKGEKLKKSKVSSKFWDAYAIGVGQWDEEFAKQFGFNFYFKPIRGRGKGFTQKRISNKRNVIDSTGDSPIAVGPNRKKQKRGEEQRDAGSGGGQQESQQGKEKPGSEGDDSEEEDEEMEDSDQGNGSNNHNHNRDNRKSGSGDEEEDEDSDLGGLPGVDPNQNEIVDNSQST